MVRPHWLARALEALLHDQPTRRAQLDGFDRVREQMRLTEPAGRIAARAIARILEKR